MRDDKAEFDRRGAVILGVNPDSQTSHRHYVETHGFNFLLLVDEGGKVAEAYGAMGASGMNQRTVVLVDREGVIRYYQRGMPADHEILAVIDDLSLAAAS